MKVLGKLITVIVPVYNVEKYVATCIESIMSQTYTELEIILVDDGSTDMSGKICDLYQGKDSRIKVIHKENGGPVSARGAGLEYSQGEYIGFVDADDYIAERYYEVLYQQMEQCGADICHSYNIRAIQGNREFPYGPKMVEGIIEIKEQATFMREYVFKAGDNAILPSMWAKLFRRDVILGAHGKIPMELSMGEDFLCLCASTFFAKRVCIVKGDCYYYRMREGSLTHNKSYLYGAVLLSKGLEELLRGEGLYEDLEMEYERYIRLTIARGINAWGDWHFHIPVYALENFEQIENKKVVLYGAGEVGRDLLCQLALNGKCEIVAWVDKNYEQIAQHYWRQIEGLDSLKTKEFDCVILGTVRKDVLQSMKDEIMNLGVDLSKICDASIVANAGLN